MSGEFLLLLHPPPSCLLELERLPLFLLPTYSDPLLTCHSPIGLPRRTLRSGKEYSVFDLALARAWTTPVDFDFGVAIQERLMDEDLSDDFHDDNAHDPNNLPGDPHDEPSWQPLPTHAPSPPQPSVPLSSLSATAHNKLKSRARQDKKRQDACTSSATSHPETGPPQTPRAGQGFQHWC
ncbi:hypothetical protein B0H14DRAFT_2576571 [Mycena olivaceomarginata]|nr:hypothetical protein B0H14DRAFT_2576571 [Mycena olivaceomarginata]